MHNPRCERCEQLKCSKCGTRKNIKPFVWRGSTGLLCTECARILQRALIGKKETRFQPIEIVQYHCDHDLAYAPEGIAFWREHKVEFISRNVSINDAHNLVEEE